MFEKKRGKRFLASVMALVMLLSLAPVGALAAGETPTNEESPAVTQPANEAAPKPVGTDEQNTENTNEETTPPPSNEGDAGTHADNNASPFGLSWNTPLKINDISLSKSVCENCDVYYYETGSTELKKFDETITHSNQTVPYGIVFFVAPHEGYALTEIIANTKNAEFFSIANDDDISKTDFYTKNSKGSTKTPVRKLLDAGFDETGLRNLVTEAKNQKNCVAAFIYSRSGTNNDNISDTLSFYAKKLATLEKKVDHVTRGSEQLNLATQKVRAGDIITYSFTVTYYQGTDSITYENIRVTDSRVTDPQTMEFQGPSGGNTTETKTATYTVTEQDIINAAQNEDKLTNTATLTYTYQAPYNNGAYTVSDTATANVTTVGTVSYEYTGTVPDGVANLPTTASHEKNEQVRVADRPNNITGYTFEGWTAPADVTVNSDGYFAMTDKSITFTGKWIANKYKVTYKDGDTPLDNLSEDVAYGTDVIVKSYSKEGDKLTGWVDGDNRFYSVSDTFTMPDKNVTLTAVWKDNTTPPTDPDTDLVDAMYFVLMPGQGVPDSGVSQGVDKYFPNASNNGGVEGRDNTNGYVGKITKAATGLEGAQTTNGYFQVNGVDPEDKYLKNIGDLGYFNADNYNADGTYNGTLPTGMANFNMTNKSIVWYVIKKEDDVYHVDGYVKGVNIELKYFDEFNGEQIGETTRLLSGGTATIKALPSEVAHNGWNFAGWFTEDGTKYEVGKTYPLIDSLNLYARWTTTYSVVTHFMDANGIEQEDLSQTSKDLTGTHGKLLSELVVQPNITGNYVYVPSETKYSVGNGAKVPVGTTTFTEANTVIHQYYYLDKTGKTDEKGKDTNEPNNYPDAWEYKATFIVKNGQWDTNPTGGKDTIVKYLPTKNITTGESIQAKLSNVPTAGNTPDSHYKAGSWDPKPNEGEVITKDMTYTYTYSWRSSGGSGGSNRPKPPVVEIPDDVPTGLNGKDHYAYIIGYGNNDVRPQNNITRAEVATIFFRLLTDETREANMTKSNGYNDVKDGDWFCCAVSTLSKMGIIKGYEDGSFKPNDPISRAEFAAIAARFDPDGDKTPASFADVTSHWAKDEISIAANHGWIKGYEDGSFKPDQKITRAETMTLVNRVLNRLPETKDDLHKDMKTWVDNMDETAWYYLAVQEATNSHYFKNKTSTKFEQWTDLRDTRDWSELEK